MKQCLLLIVYESFVFSPVSIISVVSGMLGRVKIAQKLRPEDLRTNPYCSLTHLCDFWTTHLKACGESQFPAK